MQTILLGDRSQIPKPIKELFIQTGTAHILAISGLHVGIVAGLILIFLRLIPIGRRVQLVLTIFILLFYAFLTGGRPSVIRATIMAVVFLTSFLLEREPEVLNTLSLAALILLLLNPLNIFDVGFQLSFICVLSIIFLTPKIERIMSKFVSDSKHRIYNIFKQMVSVSIAVWLGVAGCIAYYFHIVTPITIGANLAVIPLTTIIVALGMGLLIVGSLIPSGAFIFAACIKLFLNLMVGIIYLFSLVPFAYFDLSGITVWQTISYYLVIILFLYLSYHIKSAGRVIDKGNRV